MNTQFSDLEPPTPNAHSSSCLLHSEEPLTWPCARCGVFGCRICFGEALCDPCRDSMGFPTCPEGIYCSDCERPMELGALDPSLRFLSLPQFSVWISPTIDLATYGQGCLAPALELGRSWNPWSARYSLVRRCLDCDYALVRIGKRIPWSQASSFLAGDLLARGERPRLCTKCQAPYERGLTDIHAAYSFYAEDDIRPWFILSSSILGQRTFNGTGCIGFFFFPLAPWYLASVCGSCRSLVIRLSSHRSLFELRALHKILRADR